MRICHEYGRSVSDGGGLEDETTDLSYVTLDWERSDNSSASSRSNLRGAGSSVGKNDPEMKCEYTVIKPYKQ